MVPTFVNNFVKDQESSTVGIAEFKVAKAPERLATLGIGSCVVIALYDSLNKIGGLAHILLPKASEDRFPSNPAKFADTAIDLTLSTMERQGSLRSNINAKIFGGAQMFLIVQSTALMRIGERNIAAVREELSKQGLKIVAEDIGGNSGRSILFDLQDGSVRVKSVNGEEKTY